MNEKEDEEQGNTMTVSELIEKLKDIGRPEASIIIYTDNGDVFDIQAIDIGANICIKGKKRDVEKRNK